MTTRDKLIHAATEYDRKQSTKRGYNHHALALYFEAIDEALAEHGKGTPITRALENHFNDRLLAVLQRAVQ